MFISRSKDSSSMNITDLVLNIRSNHLQGKIFSALLQTVSLCIIYWFHKAWYLRFSWEWKFSWLPTILRNCCVLPHTRKQPTASSSVVLATTYGVVTWKTTSVPSLNFHKYHAACLCRHLHFHIEIIWNQLQIRRYSKSLSSIKLITASPNTQIMNHPCFRE